MCTKEESGELGPGKSIRTHTVDVIPIGFICIITYRNG